MKRGCARGAALLVGLIGYGFSMAVMVRSGLGLDPWDVFHQGLAERTGWPVKYLRTAVELAVLLTGYLLGATVGWGTLLFAVTIGPAMSFGLGLYGLRR